MAAILKVKDGNGNVIPIQAIKGEKGDKGDKGDRGLPGSGGVPDGGTTGQVLTKNSNADGDAGWKDAVQADWNEDDEASPAYVKNRTHYVEYVETGSDYQGFQNAGASMTMCFKINGIMYFNITASSSSYYYTYTVGEYTITINHMSCSISITPTADFSFVKTITKKIDISYLPDTNENILNGNALGSIRTIGAAPENASYSLGQYDFSIGHNTRAYGECCFASGKSTKASGYCAFAEGVNTEATGDGSHASGFGTIASGVYSYTCGVDTKASGKYSFAGGQGTEAQGWGSHTEGLHTIATGSYQHIQGKYNISDSISAYIVGNGKDIERSNAHTLDWDGNGWYAGDVYVGSTSGKNKDAGSVKLAREDNVVLVKSQTLTTEQQSQALANIGGLSKNQGTSNSGKFLGIGADGIVVPTEVGGGSEWTELYQGTIETSEPVSSLTVDLTKSCEGMTEAIMSFVSTKGEGELTGNTSIHCKFGLFGVTYGRLGNYSAACDDKYYLLAPNKYQSMFYKNSKMTNSIYYNTAQCLVGWVEPTVLNNPNYNQMIIDFWGSPGYQGTITLRIVGR